MNKARKEITDDRQQVVAFMTSVLALVKNVALINDAQARLARIDEMKVNMSSEIQKLYGDSDTLPSEKAITLDLGKAFVFDPHQEPDEGESVLVRFLQGFRIETFHGQEYLGRWVETDGLAA